MSWALAATAAAATIQAGASYLGGQSAANAAEKASAVNQFASAQNTALGRAQYAQAQSQQAPFMQAGGQALNQMLALQGLNQVDTSGLGQIDPSLASANGIPEGAKPLASGGIPVQYAAPGQPGKASQRAPAYYTPDGKIYAEGVGYVGTAQPGQDIPYLVRGKDNTVALDAQGRFTDSGSNVTGRVFGPQVTGQTSVTAGQGFNEAQGGQFIGGSQTNPSQESAFSSFRNTPGYQFALQEGVNAIDKSAAARGNLLSGRTIREQQRYGTGLADQTYSDYYQRLANIAGIGGTATTASNSAGSALTNSLIGSNTNTASGTGNALAAAAASRGSAIADIGGAAGSVIGGIDWGNLFGGGNTATSGTKSSSNNVFKGKS